MTANNHYTIPLIKPDIPHTVVENFDPVCDYTPLLEQAIKEHVATDYVVALNSATSAIHLGLKAIGVEEGDEILCPSLTYIASVNPILYLNAVPVFVGISASDWTICPLKLEEAIKDRIHHGRLPKALIVVHAYGTLASMDLISSICRKYEIKIIEDGAAALGSGETPCLGKESDCAVISFNTNKIVTGYGGGVLVTNNEEIATKVRLFATHARDTTYFYYHHEQIGYNYRISQLTAAVVLQQLPMLKEKLRKKKEIYDFYLNNKKSLETHKKPHQESYI